MTRRPYTRKLPLDFIERQTLLERLGDKFQFCADGCWRWTAGLSQPGYGKFYVGGRSLGAHKVVYELLNGPVADGLTLDHLCRNRDCCNPAHLEVTTMRVNTLRGLGPTAKNAAKDALQARP